MTSPPPPESVRRVGLVDDRLVLALVATVRRADDPRPSVYRLGGVTIGGDDRYRWRGALADALEEVSRLLRAAEDADRPPDLPEEPP